MARKIADGRGHCIPQSARDKGFCSSWLQHYDLARAWAEAGFSAKSKGYKKKAGIKLARFKSYLVPIQEAKAQQVGVQLAVKQGDVLETMRAIAYANIQDYYVESSEPLMQEIGDGETKTLAPVLFQGKPVMRMEPKPLLSLTREQAMAVEPTYNVGRLVGYRLISAKTRHQYLHSLGQNLGLWMDELIRDSHTPSHKHAHLHLDNVPTTQLQQLRSQLIAVVGAEYARELGFSAEEIADAMKGAGLGTEVSPESPGSGEPAMQISVDGDRQR